MSSLCWFRLGLLSSALVIGSNTISACSNFYLPDAKYRISGRTMVRLYDVLCAHTDALAW